MSGEIEINTGIVRFKVDLFQFLSAIKKLVDAAVGANEKEKARDAIKVLIAETRKTYDTIVQVLEPFYAMTTESSFKGSFDVSFAAFKAAYLGRNDYLKTHCSIVKTEFAALARRTSWMATLPFAKGAYQDLKTVCEEWQFQDSRIVQEMERFFRISNEFMQDVADLNQRNSVQAYQTLRDGLKFFEGNFLEVKAMLGELEVISRRL